MVVVGVHLRKWILPLNCCSISHLLLLMGVRLVVVLQRTVRHCRPVNGLSWLSCCWTTSVCRLVLLLKVVVLLLLSTAHIEVSSCIASGLPAEVLHLIKRHSVAVKLVGDGSRLVLLLFATTAC